MRFEIEGLKFNSKTKAIRTHVGNGGPLLLLLKLVGVLYIIFRVMTKRAPRDVTCYRCGNCIF